MFSAPCAKISARIGIVLEKLTAGFSGRPGTIFDGRRTVGRLFATSRVQDAQLSLPLSSILARLASNLSLTHFIVLASKAVAVAA